MVWCDLSPRQGIFLVLGFLGFRFNNHILRLLCTTAQLSDGSPFASTRFRSKTNTCPVSLLPLAHAFVSPHPFLAPVHGLLQPAHGLLSPAHALLPPARDRVWVYEGMAVGYAYRYMYRGSGTGTGPC